MIVFACDHFEAYIYGREVVHVDTDHKPLESIVKPLNSATTRLQRMLFSLKNHNLLLRYKKEKKMFLADTLSRAYLPDVSACDFPHSLENLDYISSLALCDHLQQVKQTSADDPVFQMLWQTIQQGWPENKSEVLECLHAYYNFHDELTVQDDLVFKGQCVVIPAALHKEMMAVVHVTHMGTDGCIRLAQYVLALYGVRAEGVHL